MQLTFRAIIGNLRDFSIAVRKDLHGFALAVMLSWLFTYMRSLGI